MSATADPLADLDPEDRVDVALYCRTATTTASAIERYSARLDELAAADVLGDLDVTPWPARIDLGGDRHGDLVDACDRFEAWAEATGVDLGPAFERQTFESEFTGERRQTLVTPVASLAVRVDGDLAAVYPHTVGDRTRTVEDGIETLRAVGQLAPSGGSTVVMGRSDD